MAAQYGVATFKAFRFPRTYNVQIYFDDTAGNPVLWDVGGGDAAAGAEKWTAPEPVALLDIVIAAATGQTKTTINKSGARIATLLNAAQLASVTFRPPLSVPLAAGQEVSGNQLA